MPKEHTKKTAPLSVLHVATTDLADGAGIAAFRLHAGLRQLGVESRMAVLRKRSDHPEVHDMAGARSPWSLASLADFAKDALDVALNQTLPQNSFSTHERRLLASPLVQRISIFNLHALHRRRRHFPVSLCRSLSRRAPVVWTLHDMWAFTGHCTYALTCDRWKDACGECPRLGDPVKLMWDTTAMSLRYKRRVYAASSFVVVTPSRWLADLASASPLLAGKRVEHIPYGLDTEVFRPVDKPVARERLGLPQQARILLASASSFSEPRKGLRFAREALARQRSPGGGVLLVMGEGELPGELPGGWSVQRLGFLAQPERQVLAFSAADVLMFPSLADNLPNTVLEAMACGTAVLGSAVGGIPEMVRSGETGWLVPAGDAEALARGIEWLFADEERLRRLQRAAADEIPRRFGLSLQAERYLGLYRDLLRAPTATPFLPDVGWRNGGPP